MTANLNDIAAQKEEERRDLEEAKKQRLAGEQARKAAEQATKNPPRPRDLVAEADALLAEAKEVFAESKVEEAAFKKLATDLDTTKSKIRAVHQNEDLSKVLKGPPGKARDRVQKMLDELHAEKDRLLGVKNADPVYGLTREIFAASTYPEFVGLCRDAHKDRKTGEKRFLLRISPEKARDMADRGFGHLIVRGGRAADGEEIYFPRNTNDRQQRSIVSALKFLKYQALRNREQEERDMLKHLRAYPIREGVDIVRALHLEIQIDKPVTFARFVRDLLAPNRTSGRMQRWTGVVVLKVEPTAEDQKVVTVVKAFGPLSSVLPQENTAFRPITGLRALKKGEVIDLSNLPPHASEKLPRALYWHLLKYGTDEEATGVPAILRWSELLRMEEAAREKKRKAKADKPGPVVETVGKGTNGTASPAAEPTGEVQPS